MGTWRSDLRVDVTLKPGCNASAVAAIALSTGTALPAAFFSSTSEFAKKPISISSVNWRELLMFEARRMLGRSSPQKWWSLKVGL